MSEISPGRNRKSWVTSRGFTNSVMKTVITLTAKGQSLTTIKLKTSVSTKKIGTPLPTCPENLGRITRNSGQNQSDNF